MKPVLLLALVLVGIGMLMGTAYLDPAITVTSQNFGAGEEDTDRAVDSAGLRVLVERLNPTSTVNFKDKIVSCVFKLPDTEPLIPAGSMIFCKLVDALVDEDYGVLAEGMVIVPEPGLLPGESITINIDDDDCFFAPCPNDIDVVMDILIVIKGPSITVTP